MEALLISTDTSILEEEDNHYHGPILFLSSLSKTISASCDSSSVTYHSYGTPTSQHYYHHRSQQPQRIRSTSPTDEMFNSLDSPKDILKKKFKNQSWVNLVNGENSANTEKNNYRPN